MATNHCTWRPNPASPNWFCGRSYYEYDEHYYVDAVRVLADGKVYPGDSVPKLDLQRDFPWLDHQSQQARDIERFRWFSNGYVARDPGHANRITDIRYSMLPNQVAGLWSIEVSPQAGGGDHVRHVVARRTSSQVLDRFKSMLFE